MYFSRRCLQFSGDKPNRTSIEAKMPCVVPNCDPKEQCFAQRFPQSYLLSKRWKEAIELGTGVPLADNIDFLTAEICQQHFVESNDDYGEPVIFNNNSSEDHEIRLSCCALCQTFMLTNATVFDWENIMLGDQTIKQLIQSILKADQLLSEMNSNGICQPCLARLDLMATVTRAITESADISKKMETFIKAEKRPWYKMSAAARNVSSTLQNESQQSPLSTITLEVELIDCKPVIAEEVSDLPSEGLTNFAEKSTNTRKTVREEAAIECKDEANLKKPENTTHAKKAVAKTPRKPYTFKDPNRKQKQKIYLRKLVSQKCYLCTTVFDSNDDLRAHLLDHDGTTLDCKECGETYWDLIAFNKHMAKHDCNERPFECKHCHLRYSSATARKIHEADVHNDGEKRIVNRTRRVYACQHCGKVFRSLSSLKQHEDSHNGLKPFKCTICDRWLANRISWERHHATHTSVKPFTCKKCGKQYRVSSYYKEHIKSECQPSGWIDKKNKCELCSAEFKQHQKLVSHTLSEHGDEKVEFFQCHICDQRFIQKRRLYFHVKNHDKKC